MELCLSFYSVPIQHPALGLLWLYLYSTMQFVYAETPELGLNGPAEENAVLKQLNLG